MNRELTLDEQEFVKELTSALPPVIARKDVDRFLGGIVAPKTLSNADESGDGPEVAYKVGRSVAYRTESLVIWIVGRLGVKRMSNVKAF